MYTRPKCRCVTLRSTAFEDDEEEDDEEEYEEEAERRGEGLESSD
jgi:hypothetical protein